MVSTLLWRDLEKRGRWGVLINNASGLITPRGLCNCCTVSLFNSISHTAITSPCRVPVSLFFSLIYFMHNVYTLKMYFIRNNSQFIQRAGSSRQSWMNTGYIYIYCFSPSLSQSTLVQMEISCRIKIFQKCEYDFTSVATSKPYQSSFGIRWNRLPKKSTATVYHTIEPKWTKIPVEQLADLMSPRFHIYCIPVVCVCSMCQSVLHTEGRVSFGT